MTSCMHLNDFLNKRHTWHDCIRELSLISVWALQLEIVANFYKWLYTGDQTGRWYWTNKRKREIMFGARANSSFERKPDC